MIDRRGWKTFDPTFPGSCLSLAGCYAIYRGKKLWYIGQSENVRRRIAGYRFENFPGPDEFFHGFTRTPWGDWSWSDSELTAKVVYARRFGEQLMTEARLIRRLRPLMNKRGVG